MTLSLAQVPLIVDIVGGAIFAVGLYSAWWLRIWDQWHHLWFGLLSLSLSTQPIERYRAIPAIALVDDAWQHTMQAIKWKMKYGKRPSSTPSVAQLDELFESPLHRLYTFAVSLV
jgi:hypothetical protein